MSRKQTTKTMVFDEDKFVNGELAFEKGVEYDIPVETGSVDRWLKRGGRLVEKKDLEAQADKIEKQKELEAQKLASAASMTSEEDKLFKKSETDGQESGESQEGSELPKTENDGDNQDK